MNIDTPEGMAEAVTEQMAMISQLPQGGRWVAPRSGSIYMLDQENKRVKRVHGARPEPNLNRVFTAMGWTVIPEDGERNITPFFINGRIVACEDAVETVRVNHQFTLF